MNKKKKILLSISLIILIIGVVLIWSSNEIGSIFSSETANSRIDKLGFTKYYSGNYKEAFKKLLPMAEGGNSNAQVSLGNLYAAGLGTPQSYKDAYYWYKKAADQGSADGFDSIASMYLQGNYLKQNIKKAIEYYRKAIESDNTKSLPRYNLSLVYLKYNSEYKDIDKGIELLEQAANQGNSAAQSALGWAYYKNYYKLKNNYPKAYDLLKKSAEQGDPVGQTNLAIVFFEGKATSKSNIKAYKWFYIAGNYGKDSNALEGLRRMEPVINGAAKEKAIAEAQQWIKTHKEINLNLVGVK